MTGNNTTVNPTIGTNAYTGTPYGTSLPGFWGNVSGFGVNTPLGFGGINYQTPIGNVTNPYNTLTSQFTGQTVQQPGFLGLPTNQWQGGFGSNQLGYQGIFNTVNNQQVLQACQQYCQQIAQLCTLCCQQYCQQIVQACLLGGQQVVTQNTQVIPGFNLPLGGFGTTNQGQVGFGVNFGGFGINPNWYGGVQPQWIGQNPIIGGYQPLGQGFTGVQNGFGQFQPQQPWLNNIYGTW